MLDVHSTFLFFFPREKLWAECFLLTALSIVRLCLWWWVFCVLSCSLMGFFLICRLKSIISRYFGGLLFWIFVLLDCFVSLSQGLQLYECHSFFVLHLAIFFFLRFYLFIHGRHRERKRQRHRQREKQAPRREPDVGPDPWSPGSHPGLKEALNRWATGLTLTSFFIHFTLCHFHSLGH